MGNRKRDKSQEVEIASKFKIRKKELYQYHRWEQKIKEGSTIKNIWTIAQTCYWNLIKI